jgi:flagellar motility protein MotE (MotC chaperone)
MKFVAIILVLFLAFGGTLAILLALTGNLNGEGLDRIVNGPPPPPEDPVDAPDGLLDVAGALNEREMKLDEEKKALQQERKQLEMLQRQNGELRTELQQLITQVELMLDTADEDQQARVQAAADTIAAMDEKKAAPALSEWPPEQVAAILLLIDEDVRGGILDEMDSGDGPSKAAIILDEIQRSKY